VPDWVESGRGQVAYKGTYCELTREPRREILRATDRGQTDATKMGRSEPGQIRSLCAVNYYGDKFGHVVPNC
jgi:hypothetical protein